MVIFSSTAGKLVNSSLVQPASWCTLDGCCCFLAHSGCVGPQQAPWVPRGAHFVTLTVFHFGCHGMVCC